MDAQTPGGPTPDDNAELIDLIGRFASADNSAIRNKLLNQLRAMLGSREIDDGRTRLRDWYIGLEPKDELSDEDYERYQALLPQVLAGIPDSGDAAYNEFRELTFQSEAVLDEYELLRGMMEEAYSEWRTGNTKIDFPTYDLSFLDEDVDGQRIAQIVAIWLADMQEKITTSLERGLAKARVTLEALTPQVTGAQVRHIAGSFQKEGRGLFAVSLEEEEDIPEAYLNYRISARADSDDLLTCRVTVTVFGREVGGLGVVITPRSGSPLPASADGNGVAIFENVAIKDLDGMAIEVDFPLPSGS